MPDLSLLNNKLDRASLTVSVAERLKTLTVAAADVEGVPTSHVVARALIMYLDTWRHPVTEEYIEEVVRDEAGDEGDG